VLCGSTRVWLSREHRGISMRTGEDHRVYPTHAPPACNANASLAGAASVLSARWGGLVASPSHEKRPLAQTSSLTRIAVR